MFDDSQKKLTDRVNNYFAKNPFIVTLLISGIMSLTVFIISLDYRRGDAQIEISDNTVIGTKVSDQDTERNIVVDLAGAVKNPGLYTLRSSSRLGDLLSLGGGFLSDVSSLWVSKNLNLSQVVSDGQKVYIPFEWDVEGGQRGDGVKALSLGLISTEAGDTKVSEQLEKIQAGEQVKVKESEDDPPESTSSSGQQENTGKVNVNTATSTALDKLPGIGPAYAGRIIENRPYSSLEQFKETSNLPASLIESLKNLITF